MILADDQYVVRQQISLSFNELGLSDKLLTFADGQQVVDYFEDMLKLIQNNSSEDCLQPVALLLIDMNMPHVHGLDASKMIKDLYEKVNDK